MSYTRTLALIVSLSVVGASALAQSPLPSSVGYVESATLPIRVYYSDALKVDFAGQVLADAEKSWANQVGVMGFAAPTTVDDNLNPVPGMRFYLQSSEGYLAYPLPVADVSSTPQTDCATVVVLSQDLPDWYRGSVVSHGFNHGLQFSSDCIEAPWAYEQITMSVNLTEYPDDPTYSMMLASFQKEPFRPVMYVDEGSYYHYGASLFSYFLDHHYGQGDGKLLGSFWNAALQDGTVDFSDGYPTSSTPNDPDLLDAIKAVLLSQNVAFDDALTTFSVNRYFTGKFDDGAHIPGAGAWTGSEIASDAHYHFDQLPVENAIPTNPPYDLGASYVFFELVPTYSPAAIRIKFTGGTGASWRATVLGVGTGDAVEQPMALDAGLTGSVMVPLAAGMERLVLVVTNLGTAAFQAEGSTAPTIYAYSAALLDCSPMTIASTSSSTLTSGNSETLTITGTGFPPAQTLTAVVSGDGVTTSNIVRRDSTTLDVTFKVSENADGGKRDLTIQNECGGTATAAKLLEVDTGGFLGCAASSRHPMCAAFLLLAGLLAFRRRLRS
jgi:hypothetical protein